MTVAENHHSASLWPRRLADSLAGPALLFVICVGFYWKLVLTDQYTWLAGNDIAYQVLPWYQFQASEWHQGRFPLWDPHQWGGQPLLAQALPGAAYPPNWLLFLLPLKDGWIRQSYLHWYFVLIHYQAALFCYLLCRDLRRSRPASVLAGAVFALGGYMANTDWPQMLNGAVWAPLVLLFLLRVLGGCRPWRSSALAGLFLGVSVLGGHHQIPTYVALAAGMLWVWHAASAGRPYWRAPAQAALFLLMTVLASGLQSLPAYEYGQLSRRWVGLDLPVAWSETVPYSVHARYSLQVVTLLGIVFPGFTESVDPYIGVTAFTLALLGLAMSWRNRSVRLLAAVALSGVILSLGKASIFHGVLYSLAPLLEKARTPAMAIFLFNLGISPLVAFGLDGVLDRLSCVWLRRASLILLGAAGLILALLFGLLVSRHPAGLNLDNRVMITALAAVLAAGLLFGWKNGGLVPRAVWLGFLGVVLLELGASGSHDLPHRLDTDRNKNLVRMTQHADIVKFLREQPAYFRVDVNNEDIPHNFGDWHGIDTVAGFLASLTTNMWDLEVHRRASQRLLAVRFTVTSAPARPGEREVFTGRDGLHVYENPGAFPWTWTVHETVRIDASSPTGGLLDTVDFDLRTKALLREQPPELATCTEADKVEISRRHPLRVVLMAQMGCRGMLILSETFFPGWQAIVDGRPERIYEAYGALRGVVLERGSHLVEFRYRPWSVYLGGLLSATALLIGLGMTLWGWNEAPTVINYS